MTRRAGESYLSDDFGWQSDSEYEERLGILQPVWFIYQFSFLCVPKSDMG